MNEIDMLTQQREIFKKFFYITSDREDKEAKLKRHYKEQKDYIDRDRKGKEDSLQARCKGQEDIAERILTDKLNAPVLDFKENENNLSSAQKSLQDLKNQFSSLKGNTYTSDENITGGGLGWLIGIGVFFFLGVFGGSFSSYFWGMVLGIGASQLPRVIKKQQISSKISEMENELGGLDNTFLDILNRLRSAYSSHNISIDTTKSVRA